MFNYDVLISLNDLLNIDYVDILKIYMVLYIWFFDLLVVWEIISGMFYLVLNIFIGIVRGFFVLFDKMLFVILWCGGVEIY